VFLAGGRRPAFFSRAVYPLEREGGRNRVRWGCAILGVEDGDSGGSDGLKKTVPLVMGSIEHVCMSSGIFFGQGALGTKSVVQPAARDRTPTDPEFRGCLFTFWNIPEGGSFGSANAFLHRTSKITEAVSQVGNLGGWGLVDGNIDAVCTHPLHFDLVRSEASNVRCHRR